jgi:purine-binding chemotaxis protein CheW
MSRAAASGTQPSELVVFRVDELLCGIDVHDIQEIKRIHGAAPVPRAPPGVRGLVNMRGQIVTLIDVRHRLGLPPIELTGTVPAIVVPLGDELVGLLVDAIGDVIEVAPSAFRPPPANLQGVAGRFMTSVLQTDEGLVAVIDARRLASPERTAEVAGTRGGREAHG